MDRAGLRAAWAGRIGLGLRVPHLRALRASWPAVGFFELLSENYLSEDGVVEGGPPRRTLDEVCARYPVVLHGVGLGLAGPDPLDRAHLRRLRALARHSGAAWLSEHLCWGRSRGRHLHELMPLPRTEAAARLAAARARQLQDVVELPIALENVSAYVELPGAEMSEPAFLQRVAELADIGLLLDVNNLYVSARNAAHGDARAEEEQAAAAVEEVQAALTADLDPSRVLQLHIAGHSVLDDGFRLDTHDQALCPPVEALLAWVYGWAGPVPLCLERDGAHLPLDETWAQVARFAPWAAAAPLPSGLPWPGPGPVDLDPAPPADLAALQNDLAEAALLPLVRGADGAARVPVQRYPAALLGALPDPGGRPPALRLALYTHQVQARLVGVLREELPLTAALLGERAFGDLALAALAEAPPDSPLLRALPARLRAATGAPGPALRAALDLLPVADDLLDAVLEDDLAWAEAFSAAAGPPLRPAAVDPADLLHAPLRLQPHLRVLRRAWRLLPLRRGEGSPVAGPEDLLVLRAQAGVEAVSLSPDQATLLAALAAGAPLSAACAALEAGRSEADRAALGAALPGWFAAWAQAGWFVHPPAPLQPPEGP
ncbi:MAG: DUF692 family protein [Deltaproteobacteria bacterium]|nr:DUF692 family protein [Deltaproteobacteria bacterium]